MIDTNCKMMLNSCDLQAAVATFVTATLHLEEIDQFAFLQDAAVHLLVAYNSKISVNKSKSGALELRECE